MALKDDEKGTPKEQPSVAQMQREHVAATEELTALVTQFRDKLDGFDATLADKVEAQTATVIEARTTGLAEEIKKVRADQQELLLRLNRPPMPTGPLSTEAEGERSLFANKLRVASRKAEVIATIPMEQRALVEDAVGEIAVPEDLDREWLVAINGLTLFRSLVDVKTTRSNRMRKRSRTRVIVGMGNLELGDAVTQSTMALTDEYQYVEDMNGYTEFGVDELMDSDSNLIGMMGEDFNFGFAELEDVQCWNGAGHASKEFGGLSRGTTITRHTATAAAVITVEDFLKLFYQVPIQYRRNGQLVITSTTELGIMLLRGDGGGGAGTGDFLWQPSVQAGVPNKLRGYSQYTQDDLDEWDGTAGNDVAIFGDFKRGYRILDRLGTTLTQLSELRRLSGLVGFLATRRTGGEIKIADALRIMDLP